MAAWTPLIHPFVQAAPPGVHEEVADGAELQPQLLRDGHLHLLGGTLVLLEDGQQGAPLEVSKNQARFLWCIAPVLAWFLLFSFACCGEVREIHKRTRKTNKEDRE